MSWQLSSSFLIIIMVFGAVALSLLFGARLVGRQGQQEVAEAGLRRKKALPLRPQQARRLMGLYLLAVLLLGIVAMTLALYLQSRGIVV